jgi:hypothetical protein
MLRGRLVALTPDSEDEAEAEGGDGGLTGHGEARSSAVLAHGVSGVQGHSSEEEAEGEEAEAEAEEERSGDGEGSRRLQARTSTVPGEVKPRTSLAKEAPPPTRRVGYGSSAVLNGDSRPASPALPGPPAAAPASAQAAAEDVQITMR